MIARLNRFAKLCLLLTCFSLSIVGCSGPPKPVVGEVTGKVTLGGSPFGEGLIVFRHPATAIETAADLKPDGTYQLITPEGGFRVGECEVAIQPPRPAPIDPLEAAKGATAPPDTSKIPKIYREFSTSGFKATVAEGKNNFDFEMKPQ